MIFHNDYIKLTKDYLRNLGYYRVALANMTEDLKCMEESLGDAKIASYEASPGGASELNSVESKAEKALRYKEQAHHLHKLQRQVTKLERCIEKLPKPEKEAVNLFYVHKLSYEEIMDSLHISQSTCKRRINNGTKAVALMIFGDRADRPIQFAS